MKTRSYILYITVLFCGLNSAALAQVDGTADPPVVTPPGPAVTDPVLTDPLVSGPTMPDPTVPSPTTTRPRPRPILFGSSLQGYSGPTLRLAHVPNMFGDEFDPAARLTVTGNFTSFADLPLAGGARRLKIAENNKPIPMDRAYFVYNHYQNVMVSTPGGTGQPAIAQSLDRYLFGFEKRLGRAGVWSIDVRMPLIGQYHQAGAVQSVEGGEVGNLNIALKRLLWTNGRFALGGGVSVDIPTGSDVSATAYNVTANVSNDAVFIAPFIGFTRSKNDRWFQNGILQIDLPTCGNRITFDTGLNTPPPPGTWYDQTLLRVDVGGGYWLYRNRCASGLTGLAAIIEAHYTTALNDADTYGEEIASDVFEFGVPAGRNDQINLTAGLHAELWRRTTIRVAGVFPLQEASDRQFDAEVHLSINRYF